MHESNDASIGLSLEQKAILALSYTYGGEHNIPGTLIDREHFMEISVPAGIATFDFSQLTRLVVAAHHYCVRIEIAVVVGHKIKLYFHNRKREGRVSERHPNLQDLFASLEMRSIPWSNRE